MKKQLYFSPRRVKIPKFKSSRPDTVFGDTVFGKIITHPGIRYRQQFAHTCRNGNLIRLTLGQRALVEIPNKRFKTCRCHGSHIQCLTHRRPSAKAAALNLVSSLSLGCGAMPTRLAIRLCDSRPNSGSIAINVAVVIEPMPLICSATWALPSKCVRVWLSICLSNSSISRSKWAISCLTLPTCVS